MILNLLVNAVRHTAPGDTIEVDGRRHGAGVRLEVTDGGEGIDPELLPRLFDRFVRADSARGRDTGGAGPRAGDLPLDRRGAWRPDPGRERASAAAPAS